MAVRQPTWQAHRHPYAGYHSPHYGRMMEDMTVNMTMSLPDDVARFVKAKGNASAYTARILRRQMLEEELKRSLQLRAEAGIVTPEASAPGESEDETLARWARVAGR